MDTAKKVAFFILRNEYYFTDMLLSKKDAIINKEMSGYPVGCEEALKDYFMTLPNIEQVYEKQEGIVLVFR